jgi:uncharacterized protein (DUF1684 family)
VGRLEDFRRDKDLFFRSEGSPIPADEREAFRGLRYFPENRALSFELKPDRSAPGDTVTLDTSTGETRTFRRAGYLHFAVDGKPARLTLFVDSSGYFLPFRDATSGTETYGAGRYLEPEELDSGTFRVDFNYAYNPYCAYAEHYSCPLPPRENWLTVPIRAGERVY